MVSVKLNKFCGIVTHNSLFDDFLPYISPMREMGAYEALWDKWGTSFKSLAKKFQFSPNSVPSDFVNSETAEEYEAKATSIANKAEIGRFGIRIYGTLDYPQKLRDAVHPVELLYFQGNWELASSPSVAIVGTRQPTEEGKLRARKLVKHLIKDDFTIISGLAKGIDTEAHQTALENNGRTMAVIGTPLSENYPKENKKLQEYLRKYFLIVSQVPFVRYSKQNPRQNKWFFPERNKLMSAMSQATIIVEAGETSGTLVQARAAIAQKRKLFILDNCFRNPNLTWPRKFVELGALRVKNYDEIREVLCP